MKKSSIKFYSISVASLFVLFSCSSSEDSENADILAQGLDKGELTICHDAATGKTHWQAPTRSPSAKILLSESFQNRANSFSGYIELTGQAMQDSGIPVCFESGVTTVEVRR